MRIRFHDLIAVFVLGLGHSGRGGRMEELGCWGKGDAIASSEQRCGPLRGAQPTALSWFGGGAGTGGGADGDTNQDGDPVHMILGTLLKPPSKGQIFDNNSQIGQTSSTALAQDAFGLGGGGCTPCTTHARCCVSGAHRR